MKILSFDIETVAKHKYYTDLDDKGSELWMERCSYRYTEYLSKFGDLGDEFYQHCWENKSGTVPAFSKILCISVAVYDGSEIHTKSFYGDDEKHIIEEFFKLIYKLTEKKVPGYSLAGHNIKVFDIPFITKRAIINGIQYNSIPDVLQIIDKKPWELGYILDSKEMWSFGTRIFAESIDESCYSLGIKSPKESLHGSEIYNHIHNGSSDMDQVAEYCENDARAVIDLILRIRT